MSQKGQVNLGAVLLAAGVPCVKTFLEAMPRGLPVGRILQRFAFTLISTGSTFNLAVDTAGSSAAEGVDDLDILFNQLFTQWYFEWSAGKPVGSAMSPASWRTIFGAINRRDYEGSFLNGASVPASNGTAKAFYVDVIFPASMRTMFKGGAMTTQGSDAMRTASWQYTAGASLTPSVVLTNGTATVGGLSISEILYEGVGLGTDVGPTWQVTRRNSLPLPYDFPEANRIGLLDTTPSASYSGAAISLWDDVNASPHDFQTKYQADVLGVNGAAFDISNRVLPYFLINPDSSIEDLGIKYGKPTRLEVASGITSTSVYDLSIQEPHAPTVAHVAQQVAPDAPVATTRVQPQDGGIVPPHLVHLLPIRVQPAAVAGPNAKIHTNPQQAALGVADTNTKAAAQKQSFFSQFSGRR